MKRIVALAALCVGTVFGGASHAATLAGDSVTVTFLPIGQAFFADVGAGIDLQIGDFTLDFNAGAGGDEFLFFDNVGNFLGSNAIVLSSLDFSGGHVLTGFDLTGGSLMNLSVTSVTADSVTFGFDSLLEGPDSGPAIAGRFITAPAVIPLPAPAALLLGALGGLGLFAARRRCVSPVSGLSRAPTVRA